MLKNQKLHKKTPLFSLTNRLILFLLGFSCVVFLLYLGGNWQNFLDENQILLLYVLRISSIFLFAFLLAGFTLLIYYFFKNKTYFHIKYILLYVFYILIVLVFFAFSNVIYFIAR